MVTAILSMGFTFCLGYGRMPLPALIVLCVVAGVFLTYFTRHQHGPHLSLDMMAQSSRLKELNALVKFFTLVALMVICVASPNAFTGVFLVLAMLVLAVFVGGIRLHDYIRYLALPTTFLLISGLALLFNIVADPTGSVLSLHVFGIYLCVSSSTQALTTLIVSRAAGAVSCLCFLSMTTPMPDIIGIMRKIRCPALIIDLMYLIYRYIFIVLSLHHDMYDAAKSRLGLKDYRTSLRATGQIYSNLLSRSYQFAGQNFDAMESRCYDTGIRFLEQKRSITPAVLVISSGLLIASLFLDLILLWI